MNVESTFASVGIIILGVAVSAIVIWLLTKGTTNMSYRKAVGLVITFALVIYVVFFGRDYFTPWLAVLWGIVAVIAILTAEEEATGWRNFKILRHFKALRPRLAPPLQLALAMILIVGTALATNWSQFGGKRDAIQWSCAGWTVLGLFRGGGQWVWRELRSLVLGQRQ